MRPIKITNVILTPVISRRETGALSPHVIVELETDSGLVGLGEMSDFGHMPPHMTPHLDGLQAVLNKLLVGRDPFDLARIIGELRPGHFGGAGGLVVTGVDLALHDLQGKVLDRPVYDLLGGKVRDRIPICYPIFPMQQPDDIVENLRRVADRVAQGHSMIRLYVGANLDLDEQFLDALRQRFGQTVAVKALDLSWRFDWKTGLRAIQRLRPYGFQMVESPCWGGDLEGMAELRRQIDVPVSEHVGSGAQALQLIRSRAVDIFNIALGSFGGIYQSRKIYAIAEAAGIGCLIGTTQELSIGTSGQAHLGAAMPNLTYPSDPAGPLLYQDDVVQSRVRYENGAIVVPDGPGLGMVLDRQLLAEHRRELHAAA